LAVGEELISKLEYSCAFLRKGGFKKNQVALPDRNNRTLCRSRRCWLCRSRKSWVSRSQRRWCYYYIVWRTTKNKQYRRKRLDLSGNLLTSFWGVQLCQHGI